MWIDVGFAGADLPCSADLACAALEYEMPVMSAGIRLTYIAA
jgi:hypothetical protein